MKKSKNNFFFGKFKVEFWKIKNFVKIFKFNFLISKVFEKSKKIFLNSKSIFAFSKVFVKNKNFEKNSKPNFAVFAKI